MGGFFFAFLVILKTPKADLHPTPSTWFVQMRPVGAGGSGCGGCGVMKAGAKEPSAKLGTNWKNTTGSPARDNEKCAGILLLSRVAHPPRQIPRHVLHSP